MRPRTLRAFALRYLDAWWHGWAWRFWASARRQGIDLSLPARPWPGVGRS
jgi:hypothetical protein